MRIIPVVDVMNGLAVRAIGGRRGEYRPLKSKLTTSVEPRIVAEAMMAAAGSRDVYVADLDAILGRVSTLDVGVWPAEIWLDGGFRTPGDLKNLAGNILAVIGTETWSIPPKEWPDPFPGILSLDYFEGTLRSNCGPVRELKEWLVPSLKTVIVLDVARVGSGCGIGTESILKRIRELRPDIELIAGGGVRDWDNVRRLEDLGVDGILVASLLHGVL